MTKNISIHEGLTYEYLVPGLFIMLAGGILSFFIAVAGVFVILCGFLLMVVATGIEIDVSDERIRKYKSVLFLKFGNWDSLKNIVTVELKYNANSVRIKGPGLTQPMIGVPAIFPNPGAAAKTFDLYLVDDVGEEKLINQFLKFGLAVKTLKALEQIPRLKIINHFEAMMQMQRKDRRR